MSLVVECKKGRVSALTRAEQVCRLVNVVVASHYKVPATALLLRFARVQGATEARQVAMYLANTLFTISQQEIAQFFNRDRTTVCHACHLVEDKRDEDEFDKTICYLELALVDFTDFWGRK
jgi:chromosomal replication initiation ATPase DnaA